MKLKNLRGHPLLSPPDGGTRWVEMTDEDWKAMMEYLDRLRRSYELGHARLIYHMRELGVCRETQTDADIMRKYLNEEREDRREDYASMRGGQIAELHYYMGKMGVQEEVTVGDISAMDRTLADSRGRRKGYEILRNLTHMRGINPAGKITPQDSALIRGSLEEARREGDGRIIAIMLDNMRELGLPYKFKPEDKKAIRKELDEAREKGNGTIIAELHYNLRQIMAPEDIEGAQQMPPLKRFEK